MKSIILVALALVAVAVAAPTAGDADAQIVRSSINQDPEGSYAYEYETDNKQYRQETGELKSVPGEDNKPQTVVVVRGTFSYVNPEGQPEKIEYYADETGFHAVGDSIPKTARR